MTQVTRRELFLLLGAGALSSRALIAQDQAPQFTALDHFEFYVSDGEKARDFYTKIFGNTLLMRGAKRYLKLGSSYMAFESVRGNFTAGQVDHVSASIRNLDMNKLHAFLQQRGVTYQDYPSGRDTGVLDPDGTRLQLSPENGWSLLNPATFLPEPVTLTEAPAFRALALDHVVFAVSDLNRAIEHYQKFLGAPARREGGNAWFQLGTSRIGLSTNERYISITVERFDTAATRRRLEQLGAKVETSLKDILRFRDPDGLVIQLDDNRA
jgi:catechol 2,3-dioxygenase-like lactoylglutathione lyase family enzyme